MIRELQVCKNSDLTIGWSVMEDKLVHGFNSALSMGDFDLPAMLVSQT